MSSTTTHPTTAVPVAQGLFAQLEAAWNGADGAGFGAPFTDDADFVDIRGTHHRSRPAIAAGHQAIFDSIYAGSTVAYSVDGAREVAPGVIVSVATSTLDAPGGPLQGVHESRVSAVLVEGPSGWAVASFHNTLAAG